MKSWTIMIYMNADQADMVEYADNNLKEIIRAGSAENADVYLLIDRYKNKAGDNRYFLPHIYRIEKDCLLEETEPAAILESENTGDPETLRSFISVCKNQSPAEHYMLMFWDHGTGYGVAGSTGEGSAEFITRSSGTTYPQTPASVISLRINRSNFYYPLYKRNRHQVFRTREISMNINDELHVTEITKAIKREFPGNEKIDIVSFDACWMQTLENAYTLCEAAHFVVASQNLISTDGLAYFASLDYAGKTKGLEPEAFARFMVQCTYNKLRNDPITTGTTISAVSCKHMSAITSELDSICELFISGLPSMGPVIQKARFFCLSYYDIEDPIGYDLKVVDLIHLFQNIGEELKLLLASAKGSENTEKHASLTELSERITRFIYMLKLELVVYHLEDSAIADRKPFQKNWGAQGINLFFPETLQEWNYYKSEKSWYFDRSKYSMPFLKRKWKKFLTAYFNWMANGV